MSKDARYVNVLVPLPVAGEYTYLVPDHLTGKVGVGKRVTVQFGPRKVYSGLIVSIHDKSPQQGIVKDILEVLDQKAIIHQLQIKFWKWISKYYMSYPGSVMNAALPSALKLRSETRILINPDCDPGGNLLGEHESILLETLHHRQSMSIREASELIPVRKTIPLIKSMIDRSLIRIDEEISERYKPKTEYFVRLTEAHQDEQKLAETFDLLGKKAFRQLQLLMAYIQLSRNKNGIYTEVRRASLVNSVEASYQQLNQLVKKGIMEVYEKIVNRLETYETLADPSDILLTEQQDLAMKEIDGHFSRHKTVLLHGVTSSGKTEIYIKLIDQTLRQGKQVLYLLPEIALTTQIINRLRKYFGGKIGIFHSRYNEHEQVEVWSRVLNRKHKDHYPVIIGARSALFLPFSSLGLIIVDEEHDTSYKQHDPAPRYNARDCAVYLGDLHGANVILGSATPSFESYYNTHLGKFSLVELKGRYLDMQMPEIHLIDLRKEPRIRQGKSHFSKALLDAVEKALREKYQVMLFQNRRGFSLRLECNNCHHVPMCINCDISLTYHKQVNQLRCHYCGYHTGIPAQCPECGSPEIFMKGFGTEKIEEELALIFPEYSVRRMDLDTTRSRFSHQKIITAFEEGQIDALVGTQMITKGLDFDRVNLVGIMNADNMVNYPDFRSFERSFQLMTQVSGRAGRKHKRGHVFIQTFDPFHMVIQHVLNHDYKGFFASQMKDRLQFMYPPYYRLIELRLLHKDYRILNKAAKLFADDLRKSLNKKMLGPEYPLVSRVKNWYIKQILIKTEKDSSLPEVKQAILDKIQLFHSDPGNKSIQIKIDVDPL